MVSPRLELHAAPTHMASPRLELCAAHLRLWRERLRLRLFSRLLARLRNRLQRAPMRETASARLHRAFGDPLESVARLLPRLLEMASVFWLFWIVINIIVVVR